MSTATISTTGAAAGRGLGYKTFSIGKFKFERDEYFAHIAYTKGLHIIPIDNFLRSLMRDVAWGFFYGTVNFDHVFGTVNHYGTVDMFAGLFERRLPRGEAGLRRDLQLQGLEKSIRGHAGRLDQRRL